MIFKFRYELLGGHVHYTLFAGKTEGSLGHSGMLVLRESEHEAFINLLKRGSGDGGKVLLEDCGKKSSK